MNAEDFAVVTLSGRPPVRIRKANWPIIGRASWWLGEYEHQADRKAYLYIRQHDDGRALVYGNYQTVWQGESCSREGLLLARGDDLPAAIVSIAEALGSARLGERSDPVITRH